MDLLRDLLQLKITLSSHSLFFFLFLNSQEQVLLPEYMAVITALDLGRLALY